MLFPAHQLRSLFAAAAAAALLLVPHSAQVLSWTLSAAA
jgi:hypothetical protein